MFKNYRKPNYAAEISQIPCRVSVLLHAYLQNMHAPSSGTHKKNPNKPFDNSRSFSSAPNFNRKPDFSQRDPRQQMYRK